MGEFRRSRSKVWWSNYAEEDTEEDRIVSWEGAGHVLSPRGSSSSPSSSHKSQDSGFSDSEASSTPASGGESLKPSPLPSQETDHNVSPAQDQQEVIGEDCECTKPENTIPEGSNHVRPKSPARKLKGQLFSQCVCLRLTSQNDTREITTVNVYEHRTNATESPHRNVDCSTQLPVKKLREKFLHDFISLNQADCPYKLPTDKPASALRTEKQTRHKLHQPSSEDCAAAETGDVSEQYLQQRQDSKEVPIKEASSTPDECVNCASNAGEKKIQNRPQSSLNRSVPVPTIRTPQRNQNESPSKSVGESPVASPRSLKNEFLSHSQCNTSKISPSRQLEERLNYLHLSPKQTEESQNLSIQTVTSPGSSSNQRTPSVSPRRPNNLPHQSSGGEHTTGSPKGSSSHEEVQSVKPLSSELPEHLGSPTHTSTPKTTSVAETSSKLVTPNRPLHSPSSGKKHGRPVNLLNNFSSGLHAEGPNPERNPVQHWLGELAALYEPECMTTLQSKSLAVDLSHQVAMMAAAATNTVKILQDGTRLISTEFAKLCQQLDYGKMEHVGPLVQSLVGLVTEFLREHCSQQEEDGKESEAKKNLTEVCDQLRLTAAKQPPSKEQLTSEITELGNKFTRIVDNILIRHISVLVGVLEEPTSDMALRSALSSLIALGLEGPHLSRLVAHCSGVRALLTICLESRSSSIRTAALRALATVCCIVEAIRQLEQAGGVEIISEILSEETRPEPEVSEAAAVLAQITAPWVEDNHTVHGLSEQLSSLVHSLTRLAATTASCETLLLSAAALANLTFMEPRTVWPLLEEGTAGKLLQAVKRRGPKVSVFLQEQAATVIANMAAVPESRPHLAEQRAVVALLCFLQIRHSPLQRAPEIAAAERVQQKSAIALSRLCSDPTVAAQVVELQGVNRLVRLCKEERERNHSDGVLVACLAALRKISANCGTKVIEDLDAMELVEPRLLDSFLIYSSRQESYV